MTFTSLSTSTGAGKRAVSSGGSAIRSQPGSAGTPTDQPRSPSTVPGIDNPMPRIVASSTPAVSSSFSSRMTASESRCSGPAEAGMSTTSSASTVPDRSHTAALDRLTPTDSASTVPPAALNSRRAAGRPPVAAAPTTSVTRPSASSRSTRAATAVRDRPVSRPISVRVPATPSRTSRKISPAVAGALVGVRPRIRPVNHRASTW